MARWIRGGGRKLQSKPLIRPFRALRPAAGRAADVAAPPYDVLSADEAREQAAGRPWSFLHISRPEIDLAPDTDPFSPLVYTTGAENLGRMLNEGVLARDAEPAYYVYRMSTAEHRQIGLAAVASVAAYEAGQIHRHEHTRPEKETDRVRQIEALNAQTGPVLMAHPPNASLKGLLEQATRARPESQVKADDGVEHELWKIDDPGSIESISALFGEDGRGSITRLYIADGHHRSAAAARVAAARAAPEGAPDRQGSAWFLTVLFPADELLILGYNRLVLGLGEGGARGLLVELGRRFELTPVARPHQPTAPAEFGMYLDKGWFRVRLDGASVPDDPVASLDVSLLQDRILGPLLGIGDQRRDPRIDFVGGGRGLGELERRVDRQPDAVAFSLYPTTMTQLMAVSDAGQIMPPKSTWFEPKLADGLVSHVLD